LEIASECYVIHVLLEEDNTRDLEQKWKALVEDPTRAQSRRPPRLVILSSKYRDVVEPILAFISRTREKYPRRQIAVIIPQLIEPRWYHYIFRNTAMLLESSILWKNWPDVSVVSSPMHLNDQ
jgi:hypothetical protein